MTNSGSFIVAWDFTNEDSGVLLVGQRDGKVTNVVNAFQGQEARDIFKLLSGENKTETPAE
jgi:hypothetical protein